MKASEVIKSLKININEINDIVSLNEVRNICDFEIISECGMEKKRSNNRIFTKQVISKFLNKKYESLIKSKNQHKINLNHVLKKQLYTPAKLNKLLTEYPNTDRFIGTLPHIWYNKIERQDRNSFTIKVFEILSDFTIFFNNNIYDNKNIDFYSRLFENKLAAILKQDVDFSFVNNGENGNGFKLTVDNHNYFYKAFFPAPYCSSYSHGRCSEPQVAIYASYNVPKKFVKFYCGKVASRYDYDAFLLTDFVEETEKQVKKNIHPELHYLVLHDLREGNVIDNKIVDFGAIYENIPDMQNKEIRKLVNVVLKNIETENFLSFRTKWTIKKHNIGVLKQYISKLNNEKLYSKVLRVISTNIHNFSREVLDFLININMQDISRDFSVEECLTANDIIVGNIKLYLMNLKYYNILLMTQREPDSEFGLFGYVIHRINDNKILHCTYDEFNIIKQIKCCDRLGSNKYSTVFEFSPQNADEKTIASLEEFIFENND